jgi:hypothetical protein
MLMTPKLRLEMLLLTSETGVAGTKFRAAGT